MATRKNTHHGSDFTKFLQEEGIYEEVEAAAIKKGISAALERFNLNCSRERTHRSQRSAV